MNCRDLIRDLFNYASFGIGIPSQVSQQEMLSQIEEAEAQTSELSSFELEYAIGAAMSAYVFKFVRGGARKFYLERMILHLEKAHRLSEGRNWDALSLIKEQPRVHIALTLGILLVREAPIRDLDKAVNYLEPIYRATRSYEPAFCSYAKALYKRGSYIDAAQVAMEIHRRAQADPEWESVPAPMKIATSSFRAEAKRCKKEGRLEEALVALRQLLKTGMGTLSDQKLFDKLAAQVAKR